MAEAQNTGEQELVHILFSSFYHQLIIYFKTFTFNTYNNLCKFYTKFYSATLLAYDSLLNTTQKKYQ